MDFLLEDDKITCEKKNNSLKLKYESRFQFSKTIENTILIEITYNKKAPMVWMLLIDKIYHSDS